MLRIGITNDDGIDAVGIRALVDCLKDQCELYVAAPAGQCSGKSHSVSYFLGERKAYRRDLAGVKEAYAIEGTPADCVYYMKNAFHWPLDLVISGINDGPNLATDAIYSGTVGAASEAMIMGIPSLAVSLCSGHDFSLCSYAVKEVLKRTEKWPLDYFLSINVPGRTMEKCKGFRVTCLDGLRNYEKDVQMTEKDGALSLKLMSDAVPADPQIPEGDVTAVLNGYISITPLDNDICHTAMLGQLRKIWE